MASASIGSLVSSGRLIDPLAELAARGGASTLFAQLNSWRHTRRLKAQAQEAHDRIRSAAPDFTTVAFLKRQREDYEALLKSVTSGNLGVLKPLATEQSFTAIKRGVEAGVTEHGARQGARIVEWLEAPAIVHARVSWASSSLVRNPADPIDFAQVRKRACPASACRSHTGHIPVYWAVELLPPRFISGPRGGPFFYPRLLCGA